MKPLTYFCIALAIMLSLAACTPVTLAGPLDTSSQTQTRINPTSTLVREPVSEPTSSWTPTITDQPASTATMDVSPTETPGPTATPIPASRAGGSITLSSLNMFDESNGWGIESTDHIMRTSDGGNTWQNVTPKQGAYKDSGFFALDADSAWATPYQESCNSSPENCLPPNSATVWHTSDGGKTWQPSQPICLDWLGCGYDYDTPADFYAPIALQFVGKDNGWLLVTVAHEMNQDHYRIYRTSDGGNNWGWTGTASAPLGSPMVNQATGLAFLDLQTGWFGASQVGGANDPIADWSIYRTQDAGSSLTNVELPPPAHLPAVFTGNTVWCGVENVSTIPPSVVDLSIYCDLYDLNPRPRYHFHYHSVDGGQNWYSWQSAGNDDFINADRGWRMFSPDPGQPDQLQITTDHGQNWANVKVVSWQSAQFNFISGQVGWAIVSKAGVTALVRTNDAGKTWVELKPKAGNRQ